MLLTVHNFCHHVRSEMDSLVDELREQTARWGDDEAEAWRHSLPAVAEALDQAQLHEMHLCVEPAASLSVEYRLPGSSSWCDLVLLGRDSARRPSAVMVELKHWDTVADHAGGRPGVVAHAGKEVLHPSEQVRGYVEYCQRFHSAVQAHDASVAGCAFMTRNRSADAYRSSPHESLIAQYPLFTVATEDIQRRLPSYLRERLATPDADWASAFEDGIYRQDRVFVRAVADSWLDPQHAEMVLLDGQRLGFEQCLAVIERVVRDPARRGVVIVEGPPGSGKSVLAARLWATLAREESFSGNIVFVTTSNAQKSNWRHLAQQFMGHRAAAGVVKGANEFNPGMNTQWVNRMRARGIVVSVAGWRDNLKLLATNGPPQRRDELTATVSIVDEAHALIDPTAPNAAGVSPSGWTMHAGPQGWHIVKNSRVTVFLLDPEQSYRDNETTSIGSIEQWAREHRGGDVVRISLRDAQFRCAGSREYVEWVDGIMDSAKPVPSVSSWRRTTERGGMEFELVSDPGELDERLRDRLRQHRSARIVAAYGRPWRTRIYSNPHDAPESARDFVIDYRRGGILHKWSRVWNHVPEEGTNYAAFVQGPQGTRIHDDALSEVGCPYVVRGFDFDYVGVIWLSDLVWRGDQWVAQIGQIHETAWRKTLGEAKREAKANLVGPARVSLLRRLQRGYRILLTRAIRGVYMWCEDPETRDKLASTLAG